MTFKTTHKKRHGGSMYCSHQQYADWDIGAFLYCLIKRFFERKTPSLKNELSPLTHLTDSK